MSPHLDPEPLGFLINDVARLMRLEFDRRTSDIGVGLTPGEARALSHVARAGTVRQSVLAERMGVEAMTLSGYLDRLEMRGLVERMADPIDRRAKLVRVTPGAHDTLERIVEISARMRAEATEGMTAEEVDTLREALRRMRNRLVSVRPECSKGSSAA